jgi:hypothetical protein
MARKHTEPVTDETIREQEASAETTGTREVSVETRETLGTAETPETLAERVEEPAESSVMESTAVEIAAEPAEGPEGLAGAFREGAEDARAAAEGFVPAVGKLIHDGVYSTFYTLTYGVVFTSLVVGSLIPSDNAMGEGVRDGIKDARQAFEGRQQREDVREAAEAEPGLAEEGLAPA